MMYRFYILLFILMNMFSCKNESYQARNCDLIFRISEDTAFSKAITDATAQNERIKFDHVGMILVEKEVPHVLEATSKQGVVMTSLKDFVKESSNGYVIKRVNASFPREKAIQKAKSHLGEPYDWSFRPQNGKMYCSELIYESYLTEEGYNLFKARPMNFRDINGNMPQFWTDLFNRLGEDIPQGVLGTNPNDLSNEAILEEVFREICDKK